MFVTIQDFTNIYSGQPFMCELHNLAVRNSTQGKNIHWLDCSQITGSDCYCDDEAVAEINKLIDEHTNTVMASDTPNTQNGNVAPAQIPAIHFFDNGNYHYMSKLWTDRIQEPFDLVVFDHHPDMQPPRFGDILSCGGWVKKILEENKFVQNVLIIGVADHLVEELQTDENAEFAKFKDRVTFIPESRICEMQNGERHISAKALSGQGSSNLYISIDKDALSPAYAATNWDQGSLTFETMTAIISELARGRKILGIDICGERAQEFKSIENGAQTAQEADELNSELNRNLANYFLLRD